MKLKKHIIFRKNRKPLKKPSNQPLPTEATTAIDHAKIQIKDIARFYSTLDISESSEYTLSLIEKRPEGSYTYNINQKTTTVMFIFIEPVTNNEILVEWQIT